ncbi:MAG: TrkA family potassium uptake protein [Dehalococcoidia bacterium]|nr:TrkA family potassium uptake protein [Dehalococcoidia bacterium]
MYVIIAGGGEVTRFLSREFVEAGHEVLVIEPDEKLRERLESELENITLRGYGYRIESLEAAGISRADVFVAATEADENNLAACQLAQWEFKVPRVVAKVNNPRNRNIFRKLGIKYTVDVAALEIENSKVQIPAFPLARLLSLENDSLEVVHVRITDDSGLGDKVLSETPLAFLAECSCLVRSGSSPRCVDDTTSLVVGDKLICVVPQEMVEKLQAGLGGVELQN